METFLFKFKSKKIVIQGTITRNCGYCGEERHLYVIVDLKTDESLNLCSDCIKSLYNIILPSKKPKNLHLNKNNKLFKEGKKHAAKKRAKLV